MRPLIRNSEFNTTDWYVQYGKQFSCVWVWNMDGIDTGEKTVTS